MGKENRLFKNSLFFVIGGVIFGYWEREKPSLYFGTRAIFTV